jgi:hypothetical protein
VNPCSLQTCDSAAETTESVRKSEIISSFPTRELIRCPGKVGERHVLGAEDQQRVINGNRSAKEVNTPSYGMLSMGGYQEASDRHVGEPRRPQHIEPQGIYLAAE